MCRWHLSTDTPFGDGDPWAAMRAAVARTTASGPVLGADERVSPRAALTMFLGTAEHPARPRVIAPGAQTVLVLLDGSPAEVLDALDAGLVAATLVAGRPVFVR